MAFLGLTLGAAAGCVALLGYALFNRFSKLPCQGLSMAACDALEQTRYAIARTAAWFGMGLGIAAPVFAWFHQRLGPKV